MLSRLLWNMLAHTEKVQVVCLRLPTLTCMSIEMSSCRFNWSTVHCLDVNLYESHVTRDAGCVRVRPAGAVMRYDRLMTNGQKNAPRGCYFSSNWQAYVITAIRLHYVQLTTVWRNISENIYYVFKCNTYIAYLSGCQGIPAIGEPRPICL